MTEALSTSKPKPKSKATFKPDSYRFRDFVPAIAVAAVCAAASAVI